MNILHFTLVKLLLRVVLSKKENYLCRPAAAAKPVVATHYELLQLPSMAPYPLIAVKYFELLAFHRYISHRSRI